VDTGTHLLFGLGLGGLAMIDPAISTHAYGPIAVLIGTIAGSNAPDLDGLLRFKSNADYIKNHRGLSHSFPAIVCWATLFTILITLLFPGTPWLHVGTWVLLAVITHVFTDLFNSHGTQALRPISPKWIAWNVIHIFDPFIFTSHLIAILLWILGAARPQVIFPILYILLIIYYCWRILVHRRLARSLPNADPEGKSGYLYTILPTISLYRWNIVRRTDRADDNSYRVGEWDRGKLRWVDQLKCEEHPAIEASKQHPDVKAFLYVTPYPCGSITYKSWGYEVRWVDIRYHYRKQYPLVAIVMMDLHYVPLQSYVGWLNSDRLEKRLKMNSY
jgi:inner membrane protein